MLVSLSTVPNEGDFVGISVGYFISKMWNTRLLADE